jgi:enamine deaminase RidA (YjgF/YER057c/UK114 family)
MPARSRTTSAANCSRGGGDRRGRCRDFARRERLNWHAFSPHYVQQVTSKGFQDPTSRKGGGAVGDAVAQWRAVLTTIKSDLEELGSALDYLIRLTFFVKGPFPNGGVLTSPNFRLDVLDEFFAEHCPKHCSYNNPPPSEVIGVAALAHPDFVIEIVAVAALPE